MPMGRPADLGDRADPGHSAAAAGAGVDAGSDDAEDAEDDFELDDHGIDENSLYVSSPADPESATVLGMTVEDLERVVAAVNAREPMAPRHNPYLGRTTSLTRRVQTPPPGLVAGIDEVMRGRNLEHVAGDHRELSEQLQDRARKAIHSVNRSRKMPGVPRGGGWADDLHPVLYGPKQTLAYAAHHALPQWGVLTGVMRQVAAALPGFQPRTMLDFGTGPGTAVWAAREVWPRELYDVVAVEQSRSMMQVAEHLLADFPFVMYRRSMAEVQRFHRGKRYDLVVAANVLSEVPTDKAREKAVWDLWRRVAPGGVLLLLDHGSPWGFHVVRTARDELLAQMQLVHEFGGGDAETTGTGSGGVAAAGDLEAEASDGSDGDGDGDGGDDHAVAEALAAAREEARFGACVVAPCPHVHACPMHPKSWCHFAQATHGHATSRPKRHRLARVHPPRSVEKYSFVALRKTDATQALDHAPAQRAAPTLPGAAYGSPSDDATWLGPPDSLRAGVLPADASDGDGRLRPSEAVAAARAAMAAGEPRHAESRDRALEWMMRHQGQGKAQGQGTEQQSRRGRRSAAPDPGYNSASDAAFGHHDGDGDDYDDYGDDSGADGHDYRSQSRGANADSDDDSNDDSDSADVRASQEALLREAVLKAEAEGVPGAGTWGRILRAPIKAGKHVTLDLCTPRGTMERRVPSKRKLKHLPGAYRAARKSAWGAEWPDWIARNKDKKAAAEADAARRASRESGRDSNDVGAAGAGASGGGAGGAGIGGAADAMRVGEVLVTTDPSAPPRRIGRRPDRGSPLAGSTSSSAAPRTTGMVVEEDADVAAAADLSDYEIGADDDSSDGTPGGGGASPGGSRGRDGGLTIDVAHRRVRGARKGDTRAGGGGVGVGGGAAGRKCSVCGQAGHNKRTCPTLM